MSKRQLLSALICQDFASFIAKVFSTINPNTAYLPNWHIDLLADYLEQVRDRKIKRLIINLPPRSLKSICVNVAFPAWLLAKQPSTRIIAASYSSMLALKHSLDTKFVVEADWYQQLFQNTMLSRKHNCKNKFLTTQNGFRFATSVGGSVTGEGGDYLIIDDPHNPTLIDSAKLREKTVEWFEKTFITRLNDQKNGVIIVVMQRLHSEDLTAHLLKSNNWTLLKIPVQAPLTSFYQIKGKKYQFKQGEFLQKERINQSLIDQIEADIGYRNYAAQFMQEPVNSYHNLLPLDAIQFYHSPPEKFDYYLQSWDTALKISEYSDYSVGTCWGVQGETYYFLNMIRQKFTYPDLKIAVEKFAKKYQPKYILIEDQASGQSLIQDLKNAHYGNIVPIKPKYDKVTRFASILDLFETGHILLAAKSVHNHQLLSELTIFPNSKHDDIIDSISQLFNFVKNSNLAKHPSVKLL